LANARAAGSKTAAPAPCKAPSQQRPIVH